jgi:hypothetical protein
MALLEMPPAELAQAELAQAELAQAEMRAGGRWRGREMGAERP